MKKEQFFLSEQFWLFSVGMASSQVFSSDLRCWQLYRRLCIHTGKTLAEGMVANTLSTRLQCGSHLEQCFLMYFQSSLVARKAHGNIGMYQCVVLFLVPFTNSQSRSKPLFSRSLNALHDMKRGSVAIRISRSLDFLTNSLLVWNFYYSFQ